MYFSLNAQPEIQTLNGLSSMCIEADWIIGHGTYVWLKYYAPGSMA